MTIYTIERTIEYIEMILKRELTGQELLILGIGFQNGILSRLEEERKAK